MAVFPQYRERALIADHGLPVAGGLSARSRLEALANLAHELRTPVQVMLGYIDCLRDHLSQGSSARPREIIERMNVNAYDLACVVENVMEFASAASAASASASTAEPDDEVDLREFFDEIRPILDAANQGKGLAIEIDLENAPALVRSYRRALRAIVVNLAINAIKFTASGTVQIAVWGSQDESAEAIELEVRDTGPGIAPEMLHQSFAPFVQLSRSNTRHHRGLGLGLAVVQRNVDALGGSLQVESSPETGSIFRVTLPCRAIRLTKAAAA